MTAADPRTRGMVDEISRRAVDRMSGQIDKVLVLLPEMYHPSVHALIDVAVSEGHLAAVNVLHEQGWLRAELEGSA